ncbi:GbcA Glycine betaine demethylase subunit A [Candidatus Burkholderia verschuerenii]|uniref:GbcA Glycine betaine demethylase subunit A n=1 Tax=Candidatus Burkholderia verschuerenii TaxID=242163 RepID=A0A0L0MFM1_9BURK|nr:Rieske 2Fe-2S domain-containing protein [Candidatus Burkholderia verschuerenii]KND60774.1 GbcA Glycine betaine demethylase subunit A [Candidatus Burkholderia verschuerenii]
MRSRMHPKYYLSQDIFEREQSRLYRKLWVFAGLKTMLPNNHSFVTRKIAGIPVVIQNFKGALHAFENVCLHRSALIQTEPVGCRPLVCPYHAWKYDAEGRVDNIPHCDALYRIAPAEQAQMKLREFALREVGNLLFINLDANPLPLEEQFSAEFIDLLASSSESYDAEVMTTTWHGKFNWKLVYENLRDMSHPRFVHPKTLAKIVDFPSGVNDAEFEESTHELSDLSVDGLRRELRRFSFGGADAEIPELRRFSWFDHVERWGDRNVYYNWLAFPNLHIASANGGHSFTLEHHIPVAPDRTDIEIYYFTARKKQRYAFSSHVLLAQIHGSKVVVGENVDVMETVQAAMHSGSPMPNQGAYESMNRLVERWYTTVMESDHEI